MTTLNGLGIQGYDDPEIRDKCIPVISERDLSTGGWDDKPYVLVQGHELQPGSHINPCYGYNRIYLPYIKKAIEKAVVHPASMLTMLAHIGMHNLTMQMIQTAHGLQQQL